MMDARFFNFWWPAMNIAGAVWLFGWGFAMLKVPQRCYRLLNRGKDPTQAELKVLRVLAYVGLAGGALLVAGLINGWIHSR